MAKEGEPSRRINKETIFGATTAYVSFEVSIWAALANRPTIAVIASIAEWLGVGIVFHGTGRTKRREIK